MSDNDAIGDHGDGADDCVDAGDDAYGAGGVSSVAAAARIMINTLPVYLIHRRVINASSTLRLMVVLFAQVLVNSGDVHNATGG